MSKMRTLSGTEVSAILGEFGFAYRTMRSIAKPPGSFRNLNCVASSLRSKHQRRPESPTGTPIPAGMLSLFALSDHSCPFDAFNPNSLHEGCPENRLHFLDPHKPEVLE